MKVVSRRKYLLLSGVALAALSVPAVAQTPTPPALPSGGQVAAGQATIGAPVNNTLTINQSSQAAIIGWQSFSIGQGGTVQFNNGTGATLNRVAGNVPSQIDGLLSATGSVYLVNPAGVAVGTGGRVATGGSFIASTQDVSNAEFMAGKSMTFRGTSEASVVNYGRIGSLGGDVALIARQVENHGSISAPNGTAALAAGYEVLMRDAALSDGKFMVKVGGADTMAKTTGSIRAAEVELRANGGNVYALAGNTRGVTKATGVANTGGRVFLTAGNGSVTVSQKVVARKAARTASGKRVRDGGAITVAADRVHVGGTLDAAGKKGGTIDVLGASIVLQGATLDASGAAGGGTIHVGGGWQGKGDLRRAETTSVDAATALKADAGIKGDGGTVVVWSDQKTSFTGTISAKGGAEGGAGGNAEVSGKAVLDYRGFADLSAAKGAFGNLLLDPYDITIASGAGGAVTGGAFTAGANDSVLGADTLLAALDYANVTVSTGTAGSPGGQAGDITVNADLAWSTSATLTLQAARHITLNNAITARAGGLTLNAGMAINAGGAVEVARFTLQNGEWYQNAPTLPGFAAGDFRITGGTFLRAVGGDGTSADPYTLTDIYGMQGIGTMLSQSYRLDADIDASRTATWNGGEGFAPIGDGTPGIFFSGSFDGAGHVISNLVINRPSTDYVGLFGYAQNATIRDVGLADVDVAGRYNVGGLAGFNEAGGGNASISGSHVSGQVSGYSRVGGLVGYNYAGSGGIASIGQSHASATVTGTYIVGGLVGINLGTVTRSYATGQVTGLVSPQQVGGLAGFNSGTIAQAYATGAVTAGGGNYVGGLVGGNDNGGLIEQAYATGAVHGSQYMGGLVGINNGNITQAYATGRVSGNLYGGGLVGLQSNGSVTYSYWDIQTTGRSSGDGFGSANGGTETGNAGLTTAEFFNRNSFAGWTFGTAPAASGWVMVNDNGGLNGTNGATRPMLLSEWSTAIVNTHQLQLMALNPGADYTLRADLDVAAELSAGPSGLWRVAANAVATPYGMAYGFAPVGNSSTPFTGSFDGAGHVISNLVIQRPNTNYVGLFGYARNATISDVGLADVDVAGLYYVGGLAGVNYASGGNASIDGSHVSGLVSGDSRVGGLVGGNSAYNGTASISQSYASGDVSGAQSVGGLAGLNSATDGTVIISHSYASGNVNGLQNVGGLVGLNSTDDGTAIISHSYAAGKVTGDSNVGGLVGYNNAYGIGANASAGISQSYATGAVAGNGYVGGLVGWNDAYAVGAGYSALAGIDQSYATGAVAGNGYVGGLVGYNYAHVFDIGANANADIGQSYASGLVTSGGPEVGGLVGVNYRQVDSGGTATASVGSSFWDIDTTGQNGGVGTNNSSVTNVIGMTGKDAPFAQSTYAANGWDFSGSGAWFMMDGATRPFLRSEWSADIANAHQLQLMSMKLGDAYTLANDIDLGPALSDPAGMWRTSARADSSGQYGFAPVGNSSTPFTGNFDGTGHTISNLTIQRPNTYYVGLFGYARNATIRDVGLADVDVAGQNYVGGLVGVNHANGGNASIDQSYVTGSVSGNYYVGGLVGANYANGGIASINQSYVIGAVTGYTYYVGGLVGENYAYNGNASIDQSYATGSVSGSYNVGGLVGINHADNGSTASIDRSYATGKVTGDGNVGGLVGINHADNVTASIDQSYATGSVSGSQNVGGLVGFNIGTITQAYATGLVTGAGNVGGFVGELFSGVISQSYWDTDTTGRAANEGIGVFNGGSFNAIGRTTADMQDLNAFRANYAGWDFATVWAPPSAGYYPELYALSRVVAVDPTHSRVYGEDSTVAHYYGLRPGEFLRTPATLAGLPDATANVGDYDVTASGGATTTAPEAYRFVYVPGVVTVTPRPITVTADAGQSKVYGDLDPTLTYSVTAGSLVFGQGFVGSLDRAAGETVAGGPYAIGQGDLQVDDGYGGTNYAITYAGADFGITPRPITVTANNFTKTYGDSMTFAGTEFTANGLQNGESVGSVTLASAGAAEDAAAAPSYAITASSATGGTFDPANYTITYVNGYLAVIPAPLTITADTSSKVYGDPDPTLTYTASGWKLSDTAGSVLSGDLSRAAGENVGTYAIGQGNLAANGNYIISYTGADFGITPRALTVTADAQQKTELQPDPALTWQVTSGSLVNGDTLSGSPLRAPGEAAGEYAIVQGTLAASANYTLNFVGNTLVIVPAPVRIGTLPPTIFEHGAQGGWLSTGFFLGLIQDAERAAAGDDKTKSSLPSGCRAGLLARQCAKFPHPDNLNFGPWLRVSAN